MCRSGPSSPRKEGLTSKDRDRDRHRETLLDAAFRGSVGNSNSETNSNFQNPNDQNSNNSFKVVTF
jgi:hypothetical protein